MKERTVIGCSDIMVPNTFLLNAWYDAEQMVKVETDRWSIVPHWHSVITDPSGKYTLLKCYQHHTIHPTGYIDSPSVDEER